MYNDIENICNNFHNRARNILFALYAEFETSAASISRKVDEHLFYQVTARYMQTLESRLQSIAEELIGANKHIKNPGLLGQELNAIAKYHIREFLRKIKKA